MDWRVRDARLREILEQYGVAGLDFIGLQSAIEELMDARLAEAYEDGASSEREWHIEY